MTTPARSPLFVAMAADLARGCAQIADAAEARATGGVSFREFLTSPQFCGLDDLSHAMLAIVDASEGVRPEIDDAQARSIFGCSLDALPKSPPRIVAVRAGGRGGKTSRLKAPKALHAAWTVPLPHLRRSEIARAVLIAPTMDLAAQILGYARGYVAGSPILRAAAVDSRGHDLSLDDDDDDIGTSDRIILRRPHDGALVEIAVKAATRGGMGARSRTLVFAGLDEAAFFYASDGYTVTDLEIHRAAIQRIVPGGQEWILSTPWLAHEGLLEGLVDREWGKHETALVAVAGTRTLNPSWDPDGSIEAAMRAEDPENAAREIDAVPMAQGSESIYNRESIAKARTLHRPARAPDAMGVGGDFGFVSDASAVVVIGRWDAPGAAPFFAAMAGEELRPEPGAPLRPSAVVDVFAGVLRPLGALLVVVDGHSREAVREHTDRHGIALIDAPTSPIGPHLGARKLLDEGRLALGSLPAALQDRLAAQLAKVRKRVSSGGLVQVVMPRGRTAKGGVATDAGHCDLAAAAALATWHAEQAPSVEQSKAASYMPRRGGGMPLGSRR